MWSTYLPLTTKVLSCRGLKTREGDQKDVTVFRDKHYHGNTLAGPPDRDVAVGIASLKPNQQVLVGVGGLDRDPEAL